MRGNISDETARKLLDQRKHLEDPVKLWTVRCLDTSDLFAKERARLSDLSDLDSRPPLADNVRHWFAGTAPLLPITESAASHEYVSNMLARVLIAAVVARDAAASSALFERAHALVADALIEKTPPLDVVELAGLISEDDDQQVVILDAVIRGADRIRRDSPLHRVRLVLQLLTSFNFDAGVFIEMLFEDNLTEARAAFVMVQRLFEWAREDYENGRELREAARNWRVRSHHGGLWEETVPAPDGDGDDCTSEAGDDEGGAEEPPLVVRLVGDPEPVEEEDQEVDDSSAFIVKVTQMAGLKEEEKTFLLPPEEEKRELARPSRTEEHRRDVWPRVRRLARKLKDLLEIRSKRRDASLKRESRELIEVLRTFLEATEQN